MRRQTQQHPHQRSLIARLSTSTSTFNITIKYNLRASASLLSCPFSSLRNSFTTASAAQTPSTSLYHPRLLLQLFGSLHVKVNDRNLYELESFNLASSRGFGSMALFRPSFMVSIPFNLLELFAEDRVPAPPPFLMVPADSISSLVALAEIQIDPPPPPPPVTGKSGD
ncbi:hypothetical protein BDZ91DRAFT_723308 [Kalaharituber pfeilii]|nr:hypothetical protein BDZ91DRAFT_723308 [Kalaharituber pfeilii]